MANGGKKVAFHSVKVNDIVYQKTRDLVEIVNTHGWRALGADRTDRPTLNSVMEEAVVQFGKKVKSR